MQITKFLKLKRSLIIKQSLSLIFFLSLFLFFIFWPQLPMAKAQSWWQTARQGGLDKIGEAYGEGEQPTDLRMIIIRIINVFLGLLGIIFVVLVIFAGYRWMTAAGNEDKVRQAKEQLLTGIIGLAIILAAYGITQFVSGRLIYVTTGVEPIR